MRRAAVLFLTLALTAGCDDSNDNPAGPSNTGPIVFTAQLSAANEVPAVTGPEANGRGNVTITFTVPRDPSGGVIGAGTASFATLRWTGSRDGQAPTKLHDDHASSGNVLRTMPTRSLT